MTSAGGGGTVVGKCGTFTSISASTVQLSASANGYITSPLQIRGGVFDCSSSLQLYWIDFDEPAAAPTSPCRAAFSLFNALVLDSGSTKGWTATTNIAPNGLSSPTGCLGLHTVRAVLRARSDGAVLQTVFVKYLVALK
jgi:hypothetical protein